MDLEQFRKSGRDVIDLGVEHPGQDLDGQSGRIYQGGGYLELQVDGSWYLILGRDEYADADRAKLEELLFDWCKSEGFFDDVTYSQGQVDAVSAHLAKLGVPLPAVVRFPQLAVEHPNFDLATLPAIPEGWTDTSWRNDACPSFDTPSGVRVYVDYADPKQRDNEGLARFGAYYEAPDAQSSTDRVDVYEGEDWDALLAAVEAFTPPCRQHTDTGRGVCADCGWAL